jgi:hypothetical protein
MPPASGTTISSKGEDDALELGKEDVAIVNYDEEPATEQQRVQQKRTEKRKNDALTVTPPAVSTMPAPATPPIPDRAKKRK